MEVWLFILGYLVHLVASCFLLYKIQQRKSVYGLSFDTQLCFLLSTVARCIWSLETRLVETWLAYVELVGSTLISLFLVMSMWKFRFSNSTKCVPWFARAIFIIPATLLAAVLVHPGRLMLSVQILVAFTIYIEGAALIPQLCLMRRMHEVEPLTSNYVALLVLSRVVRIFFWISLFWQGEHFIGLCMADVIHSVLAFDYFLLWVKKLRHSSGLVLKV